MKRRTPLRRRGGQRGQSVEAYRVWIRAHPCMLGCRAPSEAAHLPRTKQHGDAANLVPLCHAHHMEQHRIGVRSFATRYALDLATAAGEYWREFHREEGAGAVL